MYSWRLLVSAHVLSESTELAPGDTGFLGMQSRPITAGDPPLDFLPFPIGLKSQLDGAGSHREACRSGSTLLVLFHRRNSLAMRVVGTDVMIRALSDTIEIVGCSLPLVDEFDSASSRKNSPKAALIFMRETNQYAEVSNEWRVVYQGVIIKARM